MKFSHNWYSTYPPYLRTHNRRRERHCLIACSIICWSNSRHSSIKRVIRYRHREYARTIHTNSLTNFFAPYRFSWRNILINFLSSFVNPMFCISFNQNDWHPQWQASTIACDQLLAVWELLFYTDLFWETISGLLLHRLRSNLANLLESGVR